MNRPHLLIPWVQAYQANLEPSPQPKQPIIRDNWQSALGDKERIGDWTTFFQRELGQAPWSAVIKDWIPRLAPGLAGSAGYGILRAARAIHNLALAESEPGKTGLAESLGYWAARFLKLPGILGSVTAGSFAPIEALAHIKWQYKDQPPRFENVMVGLQGLSRFSPFAGVINLVKIPEKHLELLAQTTEAMARVFLSNSYDPGKHIPFILAIAVPSALRYIIPHFDPEYQPTLLRYGWQFAGAMYAIYGRANPSESWESPSENREQLIDQAISTQNEHAIICTEACLREYTTHPHPVYLAAAWEAVRLLASASQDESSGNDHT
ncbi:MAG: DUF4243 domain-containing protein [Fidelibacterota bacterium]|nr:MAG: DUF4243 domain-containing protein [Candidatus Neomarinimicrobiota bacterium]